MANKHYIRPLRIPWISTFKDALLRIGVLNQENEDLAKYTSKLEIEANKWKQAFWDLMYKKYLNIGSSIYVESEKIKAFTEWFNNQILLRIEIQSEENAIRVQRIYLNTLRKERQEIDKYITEVKNTLDTKIRRLRVIKDIDNQDMKESNDLLDTLDTPKSPQLRLITGGKDGGSSGVNWLMSLPELTIFLCKRKGDMEFVAYQFTIDWKGERGVLLSSNIPAKLELPVDSLGFSMTHDLIEVQGQRIG